MDVMTTVIGVLFVIFLLRGAIRGFSGELAPLIGIIAFIGALWYGYPPVRETLQHTFPALDAGATVFYAAIIATFLACILFLGLTALTKKLVGTILPQPFNALLGAVIGAAKVILIVSVVGGLVTVAEDRFKTLREQTERNPFSAMVAQFWINRFNSLALPMLHSDSAEPAQTQPAATSAAKQRSASSQEPRR